MNKVINFEVNKDNYGSLSGIKITIESSCLQDIKNIYQNSILEGFQFKDILTEYNKPQITGYYQDNRWTGIDTSKHSVTGGLWMGWTLDLPNIQVWSDGSGNLITGWK